MNEIIAERALPNGTIAQVIPLTFGRARIIVGDGHTYVDDSW